MKAFVRGRTAPIAMLMLALALIAAACSNGDGDIAENTVPLETGGNLSSAQLAELATRIGGVYVGTSQGNSGIHVTGMGTVTAEPDLAVLSLGVEAFAGTVSEARETAATAISGTIAALRDEGVEDKDMKTAHFNIQPEYNWEDTRNGGRPRIIGYRVTNTLSVKVRDLGSVGPIIDGAVAAGGDVTRINNISFSIEDGAALAEQARRLAVQDALSNAGLLAEEAGATLGDLQFITEVSSLQYGTNETAFSAERSIAAAAPPVPTSILTGEQDIVVRVQAVFAIG